MIWFTSDLHIGHTNIISYCSRPFSSVDEMNDELVKRWNDRVQKHDTVYVVGDMFLGLVENAIPYVKSLRGRKILIRGNHDRKSSIMLESGFDEVHNRIEMKLKDGRSALLIHEPSKNVSYDEFDVIVHGHHHGPPIVSGKMINVCVDNWDFKPISEDELCQITTT